MAETKFPSFESSKFHLHFI